MDKIFTISVPEQKKLIGVLLLTDGMLTLKKKRIEMAYFGNDKILHYIFQKLIKNVYNTKPTSFIRKSNGFKTVYRRDEHRMIAKDLLSLSPSFKSTPKGISVKKYIKVKQPSLKFLMSSQKYVKIFAIRLAMSAEGSITIYRRESGSIGCNLRFACTHKNLTNQWKHIFNELGIDFEINKDKSTWSGLHGLQTTKRENIVKFYELDGFIDNVKINRGNLKGIEKNKLLNIFINFIKNKPNNYTKLKNDSFWKLFYNCGEPILRG